MEGKAQANELDELFKLVYPLLLKYVEENFWDETLVVETRSPQELLKILDLDLPEDGVGLDGISKMVVETLKYSTRTGNPRFFDKLYCGVEPIGIVSETLLTTLNTNMHVFNVSPVFTMAELRLVSELGKLFGFKDADGITCPGGSYSNMLAILAARNHFFPETKTEGVSRESGLTILTSAESHYSISKAANALGIGSNNVVKVKTTLEGEMIPQELERTIQELLNKKKTPFFINATSGTTVRGGFDPLRELARIAKLYKLWLHVDGCWGGSVIFSEQYRHLLDGIELVDSIAWNPHKMLGIPLQMSLLLMREKGMLEKSNDTKGTAYLFHGNNYDLGVKSLQCGRKPDAFKFFMAWKYIGSKGFKNRIDLAFANAKKFTEMIKARPKEFLLAFEPKGVNICFWYYPEWLTSVTCPNEKARILGQLTILTSKQVNSRAKVTLEHSPNDKGGEFFRMVINSPLIREGDLQLVLDEISLVAANVAFSLRPQEY